MFCSTGFSRNQVSVPFPCSFIPLPKTKPLSRSIPLNPSPPAPRVLGVPQGNPASVSKLSCTFPRNPFTPHENPRPLRLLRLPPDESPASRSHAHRLLQRPRPQHGRPSQTRSPRYRRARLLQRRQGQKHHPSPPPRRHGPAGILGPQTRGTHRIPRRLRRGENQNRRSPQRKLHPPLQSRRQAHHRSLRHRQDPGSPAGHLPPLHRLHAHHRHRLPADGQRRLSPHGRPQRHASLCGHSRHARL